MLMVGFLICIVLIGMTLNGRGKLTTPEQFFKDAVGTVQRIVYVPASAIKTFFVDISNFKQIYKENEELRQVAALYAREKVEYNFVSEQNIRLQEALEFKQHQKDLYDYEYLIAQVIAVNNDPMNPTINIDLGSNHGIEKNMAVVSVDGLVGIVSNVSPFTSSIIPITQLNSNSLVMSAISATVFGKESESFGVLSDYDAEQGRIIMSKIDELDPIMKDDVIITSGLGNIYPRGLLVGTVESVQVGDFGLTHVATIKPYAKFEQLTEVFVVKMNRIVDMIDTTVLDDINAESSTEADSNVETKEGE